MLEKSDEPRVEQGGGLEVKGSPEGCPSIAIIFSLQILINAPWPV
jgi:hypothetical protein